MLLARRPNFNLAHAAVRSAIDERRVDQRFIASEIGRMHQRRLGEIYDRAGEYQGVNIAKGAFMFAVAAQVSRLMQDFERGPLPDCTPCNFDTTAALGFSQC